MAFLHNKFKKEKRLVLPCVAMALKNKSNSCESQRYWRLVCMPGLKLDQSWTSYRDKFHATHEAPFTSAFINRERGMILDFGAVSVHFQSIITD